jgi:hypothetical protein
MIQPAKNWHDAGWSHRSMQEAVTLKKLASARRSWSRLSTVDPRVVPLAGEAGAGGRRLDHRPSWLPKATVPRVGIRLVPCLAMPCRTSSSAQENTNGKQVKCS